MAEPFKIEHLASNALSLSKGSGYFVEELMSFYVYILQMNDGRLYVGQTGDLQRRFKDHKDGHATVTTGFFGKEKCIYVENHADRMSAIAREKQIKKWSRAKKFALAKGDFNKLRELSKKSVI